MRRKIYECIEANGNSKVSKAYSFIMMFLILTSLFPLMSIEEIPGFSNVELVITAIFIIDYILRWSTADYSIEKGGASFLKYPFTFMAIMDLISVLPVFISLNAGFKAFRLFRLIRTFRIFRIFRAFRYSKNIDIVLRVFKRQKDYLIIVCALALGYIFVCALVIFCVEPYTFGNFFRAIYWATVSLTTMGYGDIYATSVAGQVITMISAIFGIAIVALPAGILTAGYLEEINSIKSEKNNQGADGV